MEPETRFVSFTDFWHLRRFRLKIVMGWFGVVWNSVVVFQIRQVRGGTKRRRQIKEVVRLLEVPRLHDWREWRMRFLPSKAFWQRRADIIRSQIFRAKDLLAVDELMNW